MSRFPALYIGSERLIADSGDTIVTEVQLVNGDPASGHSRPQGRSCMIWRGRDGRIVSCHGYYMADPADGAGAVVVPSRAEAAVVAEEQAALRRVATLVARGVSQDELFAAVTQEIGWLVGADPTALVRFEPEDTVNLVAAWSARQADFPIGSSRPVDEELRSMRETGRPWRWGPADLPLTGTFVEEARALGIRTAVGVPIVVDGRVWGFAFASSIADKPFADNAAARLANFTELVATAISNAQARAEVQRLADEQAALRRVAMLVARESPAEEVFAAVAEEIARLLPVEYAGMGRYEADYTITHLAVWGRSVESVPPGRLTLGGKNLATIVLDTGRPARIDEYADASGLLGVNARETGTRSAVATPIIVEGRLWGVVGAGSTLERPLPPDAEARLASFTELVATAIANAESRADLAASRARIVAAADETRRRIERDLHDGAQQRLVHAVIVQQLALRALRNGDANVGELMAEALQHAEQATVELSELAHGILPSVLAREGLRAGVQALVSRISLPVAVDVSIERLPQTIEATAYFVVSEALTNVVKHARATRAGVTARVERGDLRVEVRDDGAGGANSEDGTGLAGLHDRVSALEGRLVVESPPGQGTLLRALLPLTEPG